MFEQALKTCKGDTSGGVAVSVRKCNDIVEHTRIPSEYSHRSASAWTNIAVKGGVHLISVYLEDGVGMNSANMNIMTEFAAFIGTLKGSCIMARNST